MIPKTIHYCWFGRGKMPELAVKCINSWKKHLPEYKLKEWNEDNFDLDMYPYAREAYDNRKFAFVTDIVRLYALYSEGGIYMDTDVEVLRPLDEFLCHSAFSGFESSKDVLTGIMGAEKGSLWAKDNLEYYQGKHFIREDGTFDMTTNVRIVTDMMVLHGLQRKNMFQDFPDYVTFYPSDFFCPINIVTKRLCLTENSATIHHFAGSWVKKTPIDIMKKYVRNLLPENFLLLWNKRKNGLH